jgi:flagellar biosynthesis protein FliP
MRAFARTILAFRALAALALGLTLALTLGAEVRAEENGLNGNGVNAPAPIEIRLGEDSADGKAPRISSTLQTLVGLTAMTLIPAALMMMTSFTRIVIVLSFLRHALSTQQTPPNMVLIGLSLFLTAFIMGPVFNQTYKNGIAPYMAGTISHEEAMDRGLKPVREFMGQQTRKKDLALMLDLSKAEQPESFEDIPTTTLVPAFVISELRTAFQMGFLLFLPFLVIDLVCAAVLMALGMVMVPPSMVSLPLKLLLFVLADGWYMIVKALVASFAVSG